MRVSKLRRQGSLKPSPWRRDVSSSPGTRQSRARGGTHCVRCDPAIRDMNNVQCTIRIVLGKVAKGGHSNCPGERSIGGQRPPRWLPTGTKRPSRGLDTATISKISRSHPPESPPPIHPLPRVNHPTTPQSTLVTPRTPTPQSIIAVVKISDKDHNEQDIHM